MPKGLIFNLQKFSLHDGPGIRTAVFFKGCPLRCGWCSNPESQNRFNKLTGDMEDDAYRGKLYPVDEVMSEIIKDKPFYDRSGGGITLTGGEVLQQAEFAGLLAEEARKQGIHVAAETTGYATADIFAEFIKKVDLLLFDLKHHDGEKHKQLTGVDNKVILTNLAHALKQGIEVTVRIPVIPTFNFSLDDAKKLAELAVKLGVNNVDLLPFHQLGEKKYETLSFGYDFVGVNQLYPEQLENYAREFTDCGIGCRVV